MCVLPFRRWSQALYRKLFCDNGNRAAPGDDWSTIQADARAESGCAVVSGDVASAQGRDSSDSREQIEFCRGVPPWAPLRFDLCLPWKQCTSNEGAPTEGRPT